MPLDLKKSLELQKDHHKRCTELAAQGVVFNTPKMEIKSYSDLANLLPETGRILDLGCGAADAYEYLKRFDYYGIDCMPEHLEVAKQKGIKNVLEGFAEELPYGQGFFDIVWARHVLEHSLDINIVLSEIKRVLSYNGLLAFCVPTLPDEEPAHLYHFTAEQWLEVLYKNGFSVISKGQHDFNLNHHL